MNKFQWWITYAIVICSFLQGCANHNVLYTPDWWDQRNEAEAIIYKYYSVGGIGECTYYSYKVNDSIYEDYMSSGYCSMVPDPVKAKYMVAYNPAAPQENKFLWHKPIFENHQQLRYDFDSIPQRFHRKNFHVKDTVTFEINERLDKTIGIMGAARHVYLGSDSILSVTCYMKVPWGYLE